MFALRVVGAMVVAVAGMLLCSIVGGAETATPNGPSFLVFGGADLWRYGEFLYGGTLWSTAGLNADGFTLKLLVNGGRYNYNSSGLNTKIDGDMLSGAALPGFRIGGRRAHRWPVSPVRWCRTIGFHPTIPAAGCMVCMSARNWRAMSGISRLPISWPPSTARWSRSARLDIFAVRSATRVFDAAFVGPEAAMLWCANFQELEVGAHLTGLTCRRKRMVGRRRLVDELRPPQRALSAARG